MVGFRIAQGKLVILFPEFHQRYGPWAVVAGASEGIGRAYAQVLAERGLNLLLIARRREPLEQQARLIERRYRVQVRPVALDLACTDLEQRFAQACQGLDIGLLVYNACFSRVADFRDTPLHEHLATLDVNCRGPLTLCHGLIPPLLERGRGGIILMSSMSGFQGTAMVASYAASKAYNINLAEGLWAELKDSGIDVMACVAGATSTPGFESVTPEDRRAQVFPMRAEAVAREGISALGKRPVHVVGRLNRSVDAVGRLMSRKRRTRFFSKATQNVYRDS